ncbi:MAG TPA: hypothetical protein DCG49_08825 [Ruminococcus sp.]|nr:hypothetical protein [Ruminococcus sp.]
MDPIQTLPDLLFSGSVLTGYACTGIFYLLLPVAAYLILRKFSETRIYAVIIGCIVYFLSVKLCDLCAMVVGSGLPFSAKVVVASALAAFFEEPGRLLAMRYPIADIRKNSSVICYAIGHAGLECVIRAIHAFRIFRTGALVNQRGLQSILNGKSAEQAAAAAAELQQYANHDLFAGFWDICNAVTNFGVHIALSLLIFNKAIRSGIWLRWLLLAILLHYLLNAAAFFTAFSPNASLSGMIGCACGIGIAALVYRLIDGKAVINEILYPLADNN